MEDLSQLSDKSFLTSLGDDELVDLINRLSQHQKRDHNLDGSDNHTEDPPPGPTPLSFPEDQSTHTSSSLSLPLAQKPLSQDSDGPETTVFGDYRSYFATKGRNQQLEDEKFVEWDKKRREVQGLDEQQSDLFAGCVIYVNGHTKPGIATIHKLVILHGGKFIHHLSSKGAATHVIASRLTPRKRLEFRNYKVVRPEWITDSIEKEKLLKWHDYSVVDTDYGQVQLPFTHREEDGAASDEDDDHDEQDEYYDKEDDDGEDPDLKPLTQSQKQEPTTTLENGITIDSKHPDFLKTFFAKSRLHHLSTWKADLRAEFLSKALEQARLTQRPKKRNGKKLIIHVDFDCFFATASAFNHPEIEFENTPVCVSHGGSSASSTADVASCNYVCRKFGIKNGTWVGSAKKLCPQLVCLDYDFPTYERISKQFYEILLDLKPDCMLPVSIDEALLDITSLIDQNDEDFVDQVTSFTQRLREDIYSKTRCTASIGISHNVLLAKLSLRKAKPDGLFYLHDSILEFLNEIEVRDLPGVGGSIVQKLVNELFPNDTECRPRVADIRALDLSKLERIFGQKTGQKLYDYARGVDHTSIDISENPQQFMRKSASIDINWGIRFDKITQIDDFLLKVAEEIVSKLRKINMSTSQVTLKLLKRAPHAPIDPPKFLGCGECDSFSKSSKLGVPTDDFRIIGTEARALFRHIGCDPRELRGISIQVTQLSEKRKDKQKRLPFTKVDFETYKRQKLDRELKEKDDNKKNNQGASSVAAKEGSLIPEATQYDIPSDLDSSVLEQLPSFVKKEIRKQKNRDKEPVSTIPKDVDLEVFQQLPPEIQEELREELRRRNIQITPKTPSKNKRVYLQRVFAPDGGTQFVRVVSPRKSPSKRKLRSPSRSPEKTLPPLPPPKMSPLKIDKNVLEELPSTIREKIMEEWNDNEESKKTEYEKLKARMPILQHDEVGELSMNDFTQLCAPVFFQKKSRPNDVLELVESWMTKTKVKGPHTKDLELFQVFMGELWLDNRIFYHNVTHRMHVVIGSESEVCDKWVHTLESFVEGAK